jgi:hypothetical protein
MRGRRRERGNVVLTTRAWAGDVAGQTMMTRRIPGGSARLGLRLSLAASLARRNFLTLDLAAFPMISSGLCFFEGIRRPSLGPDYRSRWTTQKWQLSIQTCTIEPITTRWTASAPSTAGAGRRSTTRRSRATGLVRRHLCKRRDQRQRKCLKREPFGMPKTVVGGV